MLIRQISSYCYDEKDHGNNEHNEKQKLEICKNVGRMLVDELGSEEVWKRVEAMLNGYIKENNVNGDAANLLIISIG